MAVREFTDSAGVVWRVWDVTPDQIHPITKIEDYMFDLSEGWLCFESAEEKRRLPSPYPRGWPDFSLPELEALCRQAPPVSRRRGRTSGEVMMAEAAAAIDREVVARAERRFLSPRGREWTVRVHECLDREGQQQRVLRFTADDIVVELERWPENWVSCSPEQYALLMLDANPPRRVGTSGPQRRREDRPDATVG